MFVPSTFSSRSSNWVSRLNSAPNAMPMSPAQSVNKSGREAFKSIWKRVVLFLRFATVVIASIAVCELKVLSLPGFSGSPPLNGLNASGVDNAKLACKAVESIPNCLSSTVASL